MAQDNKTIHGLHLHCINPVFLKLVALAAASPRSLNAADPGAADETSRRPICAWPQNHQVTNAKQNDQDSNVHQVSIKQLNAIQSLFIHVYTVDSSYNKI